MCLFCEMNHCLISCDTLGMMVMSLTLSLLLVWSVLFFPPATSCWEYVTRTCFQPPSLLFEWLFSLAFLNWQTFLAVIYIFHHQPSHLPSSAVTRNLKKLELRFTREGRHTLAQFVCESNLTLFSTSTWPHLIFFSKCWPSNQSRLGFFFTLIRWSFMTFFLTELLTPAGTNLKSRTLSVSVDSSWTHILHVNKPKSCWTVSHCLVMHYSNVTTFSLTNSFIVRWQPRPPARSFWWSLNAPKPQAADAVYCGQTRLDRLLNDRQWGPTIFCSLLSLMFRATNHTFDF